jgi:hypothetical protein
VRIKRREDRRGEMSERREERGQEREEREGREENGGDRQNHPLPLHYPAPPSPVSTAP